MKLQMKSILAMSVISSLSMFSGHSLADDENVVTVVGQRIKGCGLGEVYVEDSSGEGGCSSLLSDMGNMGNSLSWMPPGPGGSVGSGSTSESSEETGETECGAGNPIDLATQNKVQSESDFVGHGRLPLKVTRTYNSLGGGLGIFGKKWSTSIAPSLRYTKIFNKVEVTLNRADGQGRKIVFNESDNKWYRESGKVEYLIRDDSGYWMYIDEGCRRSLLSYR